MVDKPRWGSFTLGGSDNQFEATQILAIAQVGAHSLSLEIETICSDPHYCVAAKLIQGGHHACERSFNHWSCTGQDLDR